MARYNCERCGADLHTTNPPHLCRDISKRLRRQERQVASVQNILEDNGYEISQEIAVDLVRALNKANICDD